MIIPVRCGLAGYFRLRAGKRNGPKRWLTPWFHNLILDAGLDRIGKGAWITGAMVGTGNSTPTESQTQLDNVVAWTTDDREDTSSNQSSPPYYSSYLVRFRFAEGEAEGNLAEIGVGWGENSCYARDLIRDANGDPTTITVLSDEILDVFYESRMYMDTDDETTTVDVDGTSTTVTIRPAAVDGSVNEWQIQPQFSEVEIADNTPSSFVASEDPIESITDSGPSGDDSTDRENESYVDDSYEREFWGSWDLDSANFSGGIKTIIMNTRRLKTRYQFEFDPEIPKTSNDTLTVTCKLSWGRY